MVQVLVLRERRACQCVHAHKAKDAKTLAGQFPLERLRQVMWEGSLIKGTGWASTRQLPCLEVTREYPSMRAGREEAGQLWAGDSLHGRFVFKHRGVPGASLR